MALEGKTTKIILIFKLDCCFLNKDFIGRKKKKASMCRTFSRSQIITRENLIMSLADELWIENHIHFFRLVVFCKLLEVCVAYVILCDNA